MLSPLLRPSPARTDSGFLNDFFDRLARGGMTSVARIGGTLKLGKGSLSCLVISGAGTFIGILKPFVACAWEAARESLDHLRDALFARGDSILRGALKASFFGSSSPASFSAVQPATLYQLKPSIITTNLTW